MPFVSPFSLLLASQFSPITHLSSATHVAFCPLDVPERYLPTNQEDRLARLCSTGGLHGNISGMKKRLFKMQTPCQQAGMLEEPRSSKYFRGGYLRKLPQKLKLKKKQIKETLRSYYYL
ncbi:hypothetical protein H671_7g17835 [Cricetulus griseus]|nr:hypothetical protein H671_7g17835 [Cricetulus griseus]